MLKACIIGYGNIAKAHQKGYDMLDNVQLVAVCDLREQRREEAINSGIAAYSDFEQMLKEHNPDFVDICLPTYLHCEYTVKLLGMGYNVLCEKPMGLNDEQIKLMLDAAEKSKKHLMIGMCLRYDNYYKELKRIVDSGEYGKVTSADMFRISPLPAWGYNNWFADESLSGGVVLDMMIHDVDICRYIFGEPSRVTAAANDYAMKNGAVHAELVYDDKMISVRSDWSVAKTYPFKAGFTVNFEKATLVLDTKVMTLFTDTEVKQIEIPKYSHMAAEISFFADVINGKATADPSDSAKSTALINKIRSML